MFFKQLRELVQGQKKQGEDEAGCDETWQDPVGVRPKQGPATNFSDTNKIKKGF